jgi:hypothetical protein
VTACVRGLVGWQKDECVWREWWMAWWVQVLVG